MMNSSQNLLSVHLLCHVHSNFHHYYWYRSSLVGRLHVLNIYTVFSNTYHIVLGIVHCAVLYIQYMIPNDVCPGFSLSCYWNILLNLYMGFICCRFWSRLKLYVTLLGMYRLTNKSTAFLFHLKSLRVKHIMFPWPYWVLFYCRYMSLFFLSYCSRTITTI